ncbi:MAG: HAMP domain-containing histidine kinase [Idiomarina sp.]|uniref:sensor histidine kinase n=1 Tax=Idiomarina sp. TaxID=1874361 RepID=UPI000C3B17ED|nr:ATP-binding protein [Idiomarina sp.]MBT40920.1 HAMP domain-containing histidine kinase [Idiomarina sp.]
MQSISLKRGLIVVVLLVTAIALGIGFTINVFSQVNQYQESMLARVTSYAKIVAGNARESVALDDNSNETRRLATLANSQFVQHVHIYRLEPTSGELSFFASYNKEGLAPIPAKFSKIEQLSQAQINADFMEVAEPILLDNSVIGYVYLRGSTNEIRLFMWRSIGVAVLVFLVTLIACWIATIRLRRGITQPLEHIVDIASQIARDKNYTLRIPDSRVDEFNDLGQSLNIMLERVQHQIERQRRAEQEASQLNAELEQQVTQRTKALRESNQELLATLEQLHQYQGQLVESEKMASLGDMVAGIAHEVNTPIGLSVTASTLLQDKLAVMQEKFNEKRISTNEFARFLGDCDENLAIIYRNVNRAAELITSFKQVAVDQSSEVDRTIEIHSFMRDVLTSVKPRLLDIEKFPIQVHAADNLEVMTKPGPLNQILINLIVNSMVHGFDGKTSGHIEINFELIDDDLEITYRDDGNGVPFDIRKKIFDPFVTTKRGAGGSGLGLHLAYNLVTQVLGGNIHFFSEEQQGVEFIVRFPVTVVNAPASLKNFEQKS